MSWFKNISLFIAFCKDSYSTLSVKYTDIAIFGLRGNCLQLIAQSRFTDVAEECHGEAHSQDL